LPSYDIGSDNGDMFSTEEYFYLTKDQTCKIHVSFLNSQIEENDINPYVNLNVGLYGNVEKLYLSQLELLFINNNIPVDSY